MALNGRPVILTPELIVCQQADEKTETYWVNKLIEELSKRVQSIGLVCHAAQEFEEMGGGWAFMFCDARDKSQKFRRCEAYLLFDDGLEVGGNIARMVECVYRRLMESLESQDAGS